MITKGNQKKHSLLGMPHGTAHNRLNKMIMFMLIQKLGLDICYQCKLPITSYKDMSVEHTEGWQLADDPVKAFFDLEKIAFSHLRCNILAEKARKKYCVHGHEFEKVGYFIGGCGKRICRECNKLRRRKQRAALRSLDGTVDMRVLETRVRKDVEVRIL